MKRFELYADPTFGFLWFWRLVDEHGRQIAVSSQGAISPGICQDNLRRLSLDFAHCPIVELKRVIHGVECPKVEHLEGVNYSHGPDVDSPTVMGSLRVCGRCHKEMPLEMPAPVKKKGTVKR